MSTSLLRLFLILLFSIRLVQSAAQGGPFLSASGNTPYYLRGGDGDPEYILWCLQSEFGKSRALKVDSSTIPTTIYAEWNVDSNVWPFLLLQFDTKVSRPTSDAPGYCEMFVGRPHSFNPADLIRLQKLLFQSTSLVNSSNGINIREKPSLKASILHKLPDKSRVRIMERTNQWVEVKKGNSKVKTEWVKVYVNEEISGYAVQEFLIPAYWVHPADIKSLNDSISKFVDVEVIDFDQFVNKKIPNPYSIDKKDRSILAPPYKRSGSSEYRDAFYLPIQNGMDSLYLHGITGEYGGYTLSYFGMFPALNAYVVYENGYFYTGYNFYDVKTGVALMNSVAQPIISPEGKLLIDFYALTESEDWMNYGKWLRILTGCKYRLVN